MRNSLEPAGCVLVYISAKIVIVGVEIPVVVSLIQALLFDIQDVLILPFQIYALLLGHAFLGCERVS
jgi:type III secretory pathway component EscS